MRIASCIKALQLYKLLRVEPVIAVEISSSSGFEMELSGDKQQQYQAHFTDSAEPEIVVNEMPGDISGHWAHFSIVHLKCTCFKLPLELSPFTRIL